MSQIQEDCKLKRVDVVIDLTNAEMAIYQAIDSKDWKIAREGLHALILIWPLHLPIFAQRLETIRKIRCRFIFRTFVVKKIAQFVSHKG